MFIRVLSVFLMTAVFMGNTKKPEETKIREAVRYIHSHYPESRLRDYYKSFFQDFYGPGHLLSDTTAAIAYLEHELKQVEAPSQHKTAEFTGYKHNFVRVDLYSVKSGNIPYGAFKKAFLESGEKFQLPSIAEWKEVWSRILSEIEQMNLKIPGFEQDKKYLNELLSKGEYVVHHSQPYLDAYTPHYRIILYDIYKARFEE